MKLCFIHIPKNGGTSIKLCKLINSTDHSKSSKNYKNSFVVLRNPIERFISGFNWAISTKEGQGYKERLEYFTNLETPGNWIDLLINKDEQAFEFLNNQIHFIDGTPPNFTWIFEPQSSWVKSPNHILLMDNLKEELSSLLSLHNVKWDLPHINKSKGIKKEFTVNQLNWIHETYKQDFELYNYWKNIQFENRINLNHQYYSDK